MGAALAPETKSHLRDFPEGRALLNLERWVGCGRALWGQRLERCCCAGDRLYAGHCTGGAGSRWHRAAPGGQFESMTALLLCRGMNG